ncbi:MAG: hypothetical protein IT384_32035 [Deltaproteobacteria bacterium]|nr:hypothetical protein [Deltaproteobacteria bacterium]
MTPAQRRPRLALLPLTITIITITAIACGEPDPPPPPPEKPAWSEAFAARDLGWLLSVWGPSGSDLYAVGGAPAQGVVMHFDGSAWSRRDLGLEVPLLNWVYGFASDDLSFAGARGTLLHFDGARFTRSATITDQDLWGVWGASPDDLWAVGGNGAAAGQATVLRFDGARWRKVELPVLQRPNVFAFFKVWGSAHDDVYIVGQRGAVLHWNGSELGEISVGATVDLISLWGTGRDRVAIVGGRANGELITWDGASWTRHPLAPLAGLNGVWMRDPMRVHLVGEEGTIATYDWGTATYELEEAPTRLSVHAIFGDSSGKLTAVGGSLLSIEPPYRGVALTRGMIDRD